MTTKMTTDLVINCFQQNNKLLGGKPIVGAAPRLALTFLKKLPQFLGERIHTSSNNFLPIPRKMPADVYRQGTL
jgi:hypothetical protein